MPELPEVETVRRGLEKKLRGFIIKNVVIFRNSTVAYPNDKKDFIEGAKVAYETIITNFSKGSIKEIKSLLDRKVLNQFQEAISNREKNGIKSETTFIGINSAEIKNHEQKDNVLEVTVDFISEIISCNRDKDSKILTGDPEKVKKVYDTWRFSRNLNSNDPNWILVETNI